MLRILLLTLSLLVGVEMAAFAQAKHKPHPKAEKYYHQAQDQLRARKFDAALELLHKAIEKDAQFSEAYLTLAGLYKIMGNKTASYENYKKGLEVAEFSPARMNDYFAFGEMALAAGEYELA
ncbi:MAG: hypothetical protein LPK19_12765, partial [Hymenobacteraceae bacterium]|nr:hypothetical protein [Hymenobacteraceae bacterium]MDX5397093.1 hypothetical protein [Hymenobacteraceae bacterium]MDX5513171.1 hypothetical protein [Hymenobacteraceae bacterium]